ncbi:MULTISPECIES: RNA polymerase factor sigma-54 [Pseudoalteromonas]|uniref:RNA polymerase sigma-54 factor n=1 Tax=Pseudoalteromonas ruthenica TaxID=151081 RepID=A0A0F4Q2X8_9GAMM|nr:MULTISPECIES: RNA polymerase factor sigma-54 [Pseudoalteromonas]KJY97693.1 RNA polymerase factor sigma-54 [Pseudoalteromonas ruthenica]KJZ01720.1 RNA polymerase factor sigma-54 [Pseudoalteromonas ruthenica]MCF2862597.1 RNA polymerase factor sigma-54 [Pseudoalteromonas sp. CNAT2-18]MCG7558951.1 RNA polymerase factor sigma-54 [Pseudoalteromonas sp. CNAT2-18.1]MCG7567409.1 RNA polymerase factor sigma-54 [Pseudoalteromonas sp. CnMc7-15]|tara:strand:- start:650 stop:2146 length:1497 start_codon:yes stop_codon:yes gene_type:complete
MRQSLQLRLGQQLTMTPQLQQAIRLLQLSTLDLQQEIQEALDANPLLEVEEDNYADNNDNQEQKESTSDNQNNDTAETASASKDEVESADAMNNESISEDLPMDVSWDEYISAAPVASSGPMPEDESIYQGETTESLHDYLMWQLQLTPFSATDEAIATAIIEAINDNGILTVSCEDLLESLNHDEQDDGIELDEIEAVLKRIQLFDPVGIGARSLQECLLIQLKQFDPQTPWLEETKEVVCNYIDLLGSRDYRTLMKKTKLKEAQLKEVMTLIHSLNPTPAATIVREQSEYVIPDVSVKKVKGRWVVELNPDSMPKIRVNDHYASMSRSCKSQSDSQFIRSHLQEAKWFIKSLEQRNDTLLKVTNCIVQQQQAFFEHGEEAMKPMVLNDVAEMVEMHESTISRVTTQKYMHTPRGIFELKYFFSSHVTTENGGECSSTAIRALIKKLVAAENPAKPLSDSKIADVLAEQGIKVARRTIAKYRESLAIPPSNQRKSLI